MDSKILKDMYETAKGMYKAGTMPRNVYLNFKQIYESQKTGNKVSKKSKQFLTESASGDTISLQFEK